MALQVTLRLYSHWRLNLIMRDRGISNEELCDRIKEICGKAPNKSTVNNWRTALHRPNIRHPFEEAMLQALDCTLEELWTPPEEPVVRPTIGRPRKNPPAPNKAKQRKRKAVA